MEGQVPDEVKQERYRRAMELQRQIAEETARAQVGRTLRVLTDDPFSGRTESDAPDVDCRVIFEEEVPVGQFLDVKIGDTDVYDLVAEPVESPG
jgi:ribosomal protein S12 methylthiotransferase